MIDFFAQALCLCAAAICIWMLFVWLLAVKIDRFSIVDPAWAFAIVFSALLYSVIVPGFETRKNILVVLAALWGGRLAKHLLQRLRHEGSEDTRYLKLRETWKSHLKLNFFFFFQAQALSVVILSGPFLLIAFNPSPNISFIEYCGIALWAVGFLGETLADIELKRFKSDPANKGKVCQAGLWNFSRHPNYFFEWLIWLGYFMFALPAPMGLAAIVSPAVMFYFLMFVSGVPPAEEQSLKSKGDAYRVYQRTTSVFIPWFKKN